MYKVDCIILAAGNSKRMNLSISKQFVEIMDKPILYYSLDKFLNNSYIDNLYLVLEDKYVDYCKKNILSKFFDGHNVNIVLGGKDRQDSVYNALLNVKSDYVLIHDSARPFVSCKCINDSIRYAYEYGASSCYVSPSETIKFNDNGIISTIPREDILIIQTPQCFKTDKIRKAYEKIKKDKLVVTDESSALDLIDESTYFYLGDKFNIKITTKEDLYIGESILKNISGEAYNEDI